MKGDGYVFSRLAVHGFRRLSAVDIELRPLMVLIGANGVGKTSFLDLWAMLAEAASLRLEEFISEHGGLAEIITRERQEGTHGREMFLQAELSAAPKGGSAGPSQRLLGLVPGRLDYRLKLVPAGPGYAVHEEALSQFDPQKPGSGFKLMGGTGRPVLYLDTKAAQLLPPTWEVNPLETALAQVPKGLREAESLRRQLASSAYYGPLDVSAQARVRLPQPVRPSALPGKDGEDLVSCLFSIRETDRDRFEMVEDALRAAFPDFERLDFPPVAAGTLSMTWKDRRFARPFYTSQLSEGTLRYLWLTALLSSGSLPAVTMIDEPEVSLHPELLSQLAELMRESSRRTQLIVATHSDRLVRFLQPREVLVCDLEEGEARLRWADSLDLDHWLKDYTLDEVWRLGQLGGRAQ